MLVELQMIEMHGTGVKMTQQIWNAVQQAAHLTSSGVDGISHEFYVTLWETIKNDLMNKYNLMFQARQIIPPTPPQNLGIIVGIPKTPLTADRAEYRAFILLNSEYTIFSLIIANRTVGP